MVIIYKTIWKLCRTLKLRQMVAVCFPFISYKFQHQPSSPHTVVSIRANSVRDIRSIFHGVFFFMRECDGFQTSVANLGYKTPIGLHEKVFGSSKSSVGSYLKIGLHFTRHLKIGLHFTKLCNSRGCRQMRAKVVKMKFIFSIYARIGRIIKTFLFLISSIWKDVFSSVCVYIYI